MSRTIQEWLEEGSSLYETAVQEYQELEHQLADLETRLAAKRDEVNHLARVLGRPPLELSADEAVTGEIVEMGDPAPASPRTASAIARVLSGGGFGNGPARR